MKYQALYPIAHLYSPTRNALSSQIRQCIEAIIQAAKADLGRPAGVGESGMGAYHGKASFDTFSHSKSVLRRKFWLELGWRYAPYTAQKLKQIKGIVTG